jgi:SNF2 family DNA or RNA helicase
MDKEKVDTLNKVRNNRCEIAITSHETARIEIEALTSIEWSAIIVDEFHKLKNDQSQIAQTFQTFATKIRIGLSGTILQNNLIELWALLDWYNKNTIKRSRKLIFS